MSNGWTEPKQIGKAASRYGVAVSDYIHLKEDSEKEYKEASETLNKYLNKLFAERSHLGKIAAEALGLIDELIDSDSVIVGDWEERAKAFMKKVINPETVKEKVMADKLDQKNGVSKVKRIEDGAK